MDLKGTQLLFLFFAFLCAQVRKLNGDSIPGCIPIERNALLGFKEGLKDPTNRLSSWVGDGCCTWEGISCHNRTGHVIKLDLRNPHPFSDTDNEIRYYDNKRSLGGELRPSLLGLKHLNYLDLSMNYFGGIRIPEFMGSFCQLKYLNLSYAALGGPIPHQLGNLSSLQYLDLRDNYVLRIQKNNDPFPDDIWFDSALSIDNALWISHLSSLRYLNMGYVNFREGAHWLQALNMLPSIVEVYLPCCGINTIPLYLPHVNFTSLSALDLSWNFIISTIPGWLCNISSLEHLDLSDNSIDSMIPGYLFNISSLEYLDLSNNFINSTIPGWFFNISSLEHLDLRCNCIWGIILPAIKNLASLKFLDLSYNWYLDGKIPTSLGGLCKLQYLGLSEMNISKKLHEFNEVFTGCIKNSLETLYMPDTQLSGYLPDWLWDFRMLKSLDLSYNSISGPLPQSIGRLSALEGLYLSHNELNGTIPEILGRLVELVYLDLRWNFLEGAISEEHFANLTKLKSLDLSQNQLILNLGSDWIPPFQLQSLYISSCKLGPRFPAWLRMQKNITGLDMLLPSEATQEGG